ncbi:MAG: DivIVA domain-containing protein [Oscillospiraceae bacterium]|nr:DivIVA domain-containing protein [Oscillospiraceae bacterium]
MKAKDISSRIFDRGFNGYKIDEVGDFLKEVADEFSQLQSENQTLEKKLEVLADRIRDYRNDEEALKEAMVGAQKTGQAAIADAKAKAKKLLEESQDKSDTMLADARDKSDKLKKEAENMLKKATDEARRIHEEATIKHARMENEYRDRLEVNKEILYKTKNEVTRFRQKLMEDFSRVTAIIEALPEACENEFVSKTLTDFQKERNVTLKKPAVKPVSETDKKKDKPPVKDKPLANINMESADEPASTSDALFDEFATKLMEDSKPTSFEVNADTLLADLTTEINFEPVFEEESHVNTDEDFSNTTSDKENDPFYDKSSRGENKGRQPLEFGANAKNSRKK